MPAQALVIHRAQSFVSRLLGLLARPTLLVNEALYLAPCASIHTVLMRYCIDVAFVDRDGRVLKLVSHLKPFRMAWCWGAHGVLELTAGGLVRHDIRVGQLLALASKSRA